MGHELLAGRPLYSDLWDNKPPAFIAIYAAAIAIAGYGWTALFFLNVVCGALVLWAVYVAGCRNGESGAGLWAAFFWTLISGALLLEGNLPNGELFMNVGLTAAFALVLREETDDRHWIAAGFLWGVATLCKQVAILPMAAICIADARPHRVRRWGMAFGVLIGLWVLCFGYFAATHRAHDFFDAVIRQSVRYAHQTPAGRHPVGNLVHSLRLPIVADHEMPGALMPLAVLAVLCLCGLFFSFRNTPRAWRLWIGYAIGVHLAIAAPARYYSHYYQLWLPVLAIGGGWALAAMAHFSRRMSVAIGCCSALALLPVAVRPFTLSPDDASRLVWGNRFVADRNAGLSIAKQVPASSTIFEWGNAPGIYYYSGRRPPTGVMSVAHLAEGPTYLSQRLLDDLQRHPPAVVVSTSGMLTIGRLLPVLKTILQRYPNVVVYDQAEPG